jgi:beta-glucanase (GH16 family)
MMLSLLLLLSTVPALHGSWSLVWEDTFDSPSVNESIWNIYANVSEGRPPSWNQIELYTADNVFVRDGKLVLRTRPQDVTFGGVHYNVTSGRVDTANKKNITYGRVEVTALLQNDAANGLHTAHWLLGYGCWPESAEIDIMECQSPHNVYNGALGGTWQVATSNYHIGPGCGKETHHTTGTSAWPKVPTPSLNYSASFNTFAVEWNATDLVFFVGDQRVNHVWAGMPGWAAPFPIPSWPMYLILSQAYMAHRPLGDPPQWAWPVEQLIDSVRVLEWV